MSKTNVRKMVFMAMLAALSVVLVWLVHFPIFPAAPFLEYDPADIPILIATFAYGPVAGLLITLVASIIQGLTVSASGGIYGVLMHIIATGTYVLVAGFIYKYKKSRIGAVVALLLGTLAMGVVMSGANLLITPLFMGVPTEAVASMLLPVILPFNLIKAGVNGILVFVLYKRVGMLIKSEKPKTALSTK